MKLCHRTDWLEALSGFLLLTAAAAACLLSGAPKIEVFGLLVAGNAAFAAHLVRRRRLAHFGFSAAAAFGFLYAAVRWLDAGDGLPAAFAAVMGFGWLVCASSKLRRAEAGPESRASRRPHLAIWGGGFIAAAPVILTSRPLTAAALLAIGVVVILFDRPAAAAWRRTAAPFAAAAATAALAIVEFAAGSPEGAAFFAAAAALLAASRLFPDLRFEHEPGEGMDQPHKEIQAYNRIGETAVWTVTTIASFYVLFFSGAVFSVYFAALFLTALNVTVNDHLISASRSGPRSYFISVYVLIAALLLVTHATGGFQSPFVYFVFAAVFAGSVVVPAGWVISIAVLLIFYFLIEFLLMAVFGYPGLRQQLYELLFLSAAVSVTGLYTMMVGRKREAIESELRGTNARLELALREAVHERKAFEEQSAEMKKLNEDLLQMRAALMNVLEDVEESKRELEQSHRRDSAIFQALGEGLVAGDRGGRIFLCNPAAAAILGAPVEKVIGGRFDRILQFFPEDGDVLQTQAIVSAFAGGGGKLPDKLTLMRADGRRVPVAGVVAPFLDEKNRVGGVVLAFRDIAAEREIERQKSSFIAIASHQLRTPLSALRWFLDLLLGGDAGPVRSQQREFLSDMQSSVVRMAKLVDDLLGVSRVESGKLAVNFAAVGADVLAAAAAKDHRPMIEERRQKFSLKVEKGLPNIRVDPVLAGQALSNILTNAVRYTPEGGKLGLDVRRGDGGVVFEVWDEGLGIPEAQQRRVFEKFFRADNVVLLETVGTGLGLYLTKTILNLMGARIRFESREGRGSRFFLAFPAA